MIDWNRVAVLRDEVGTDDFEEIVDLFLEEVDESVSRLQSEPDPAKLGDDLHCLKGSAAGLGFSIFAGLCQVGESLCASGRVADVDLSGILVSYADSRRIFLEGLPKALAG